MIRELVFAFLHVATRVRYRFARLGKGSIVKPFPRKIHGTQYIFIGEGCFFGDGLVLVATKNSGSTSEGPKILIGDRCVFGAGAFISCTHSIHVGADVLTSARVFIGDSYHGYSDPSKPIIQQGMEGENEIKIGDGSFLGIGCAVLSGVTLGKNCFVGANAVVTKSFGDYSVIAGNPARLIKRYDLERKKWVAMDDAPVG